MEGEELESVCMFWKVFRGKDGVNTGGEMFCGLIEYLLCSSTQFMNIVAVVFCSLFTVEINMIFSK